MYSHLLRRSAPLLRTATQSRSMGGHAHVEYHGFEKTVRGFLPKDEHIVMGILGGYFGLYLVAKGVMAMGGKKKAPVKAEAAHGHGHAAHGSAVPDVNDAAFGTFLESEANVNTLIAEWSK